MIQLSHYLAPERVIDLRSRTKEAALLELVETFREAPEVADRDKLLQAVLERERIVSTGIGLGVAIPHAKIPEISEFVMAYGRSREGIPFDSLDDKPVHHVVLIAGPADRQPRYLQILGAVTLKLKRAEVRQALEQASSAEDLHRALVSA